MRLRPASRREDNILRILLCRPSWKEAILGGECPGEIHMNPVIGYEMTSWQIRVEEYNATLGSDYDDTQVIYENKRGVEATFEQIANI